MFISSTTLPLFGKFILIYIRRVTTLHCFITYHIPIMAIYNFSNMFHISAVVYNSQPKFELSTLKKKILCLLGMNLYCELLY